MRFSTVAEASESCERLFKFMGELVKRAVESYEATMGTSFHATPDANTQTTKVFEDIIKKANDRMVEVVSLHAALYSARAQRDAAAINLALHAAQSMNEDHMDEIIEIAKEYLSFEEKYLAKK